MGQTLADLISEIGITPPQTPQQRFYQRPRLPGDALMQPGDVQPAAPSQIGGYLIDRSLARHADQEAQRGAQIMQRNGVDPTGNAPRSLPQVLGDVGNMAFEGTGLPAAKRAIQHTYNSMQMGVGDQSMAEARAGTDNALMAGLNVAMLAGPHMLPELPARRLPLNAAQQAQVADAGLGGMFDEAGSLASPEQALGRPLTPDHIWNDPRFKHRMAMTSDLEGAAPPVDRFRIAGERMAEIPPKPPNDLEQWRASRTEMLPILRGRQMGVEANAEQRGVIPYSMDALIYQGRENPRGLVSGLDNALGDFSVGGAQENTPLLGTPDIAADPMANIGGLPPRRLPQFMTTPNEDRYLFGRPNPPTDAATPLPQNPTRDLGYSNGSLLPVRPREPFRQSLVGGSADLADAALPPRRLPQQAQQAAPDAGAFDYETARNTIRPLDAEDHAAADEFFHPGHLRDVLADPDPMSRGAKLIEDGREMMDRGETAAQMSAAESMIRNGQALRATPVGGMRNITPQIEGPATPDGGVAPARFERTEYPGQNGTTATGYRSGPNRLDILPDGSLDFFYKGSTTGSGTPAEAVSAFRWARDALRDDMARTGRNTYSLLPATAQQAKLYRSAFPSSFPDFNVSEQDGRFILTRRASNPPARGGTDRLVAPTQTRTVKQNFPADERRGLRSYQSQNVDVTIERKSGDAAAHVGWALRGQPPQSLAARAQLEQEGIAASVEALKQDAAANPRAAYKFQGFNQALMRRYRRIVDEHAASAGFDVSMEDGSLVLRRKPASQSNPPNGGGSDPAKPPDPALPPQRRPRT